MRRIAVTDHAVDRYAERVQGAGGLTKESVRSVIRMLVDVGFEEGAIQDHPTESDRRIIPFRSGPNILFLSIGPNKTGYPGDLAVIGVLFENELRGKVNLGVTLGDVAPPIQVPQGTRPPQFILRVGDGPTVESYDVKDSAELDELIKKRKPTSVSLYALMGNDGPLVKRPT